MKEFSGFLSAMCAMLLQTTALPALAEQHREFSLPKTSKAEAITGRIDWPSGRLESWSGPVVLIVPGQRAPDRDGWSLLAMGTTWQERSPYLELASALVKNGAAVVRLDAPEVKAPAMKCRDTVRNEGLSEAVIVRHCLNMDIVQRSSPAMQIAATEYAATHAIRWMPKARQKLVLLAVGDDISQVATILDKGRVAVLAFAAIGGAASDAIETGQPVVKPTATAIPIPIPNASVDPFGGTPAPIDVMVRRRVPGLFMWGELSSRLSAELQAAYASAANTSVDMQTTRFREYYHLLSRRSDEDWMEPHMVEQVAETISDFINKQLLKREKNPPAQRQRNVSHLPTLIAPASASTATA